MTYDNEEMKRQKEKLQGKLALMWTKANSLEEFLVEVDKEIPQAPKSMLFAFKTYYFKRRHPFMYFLAHLLVLLTSAAASAVIIRLVQWHLAFATSLMLTALIYLVFELTWLYVAGHMHKIIKCHEDMCI